MKYLTRSKKRIQIKKDHITRRDCEEVVLRGDHNNL